ncbi:hypothetical protein ES703_52382 [subsurface metagenome]
MRNLSDDFDDYDDIIGKLKKFFNFDSNLFDMDFFIFPEMSKKLDPKKKRSKGYKISYHFETGMDEPEIKIEGDIDEKELNQYLRGYDFGKDPRFKVLKRPTRKELIDAKELSLEPTEQQEKSHITEPFIEVNDFTDFTQIIIEVPGIEKGDIKLDLNDKGNKLIISAENQIRKYIREVYLPFKTSLKNYNIEVNNGIATLKIWRS